jgi:hypothetical protein
MAKVAIKYDNIVPDTGICHAMNEFRSTAQSKLVDGRLNVRRANYGFQYSDIKLALFCVYLCGEHQIQDITTIIDKHLSTTPNARIPSADTIARRLKELRALRIAYTSKTDSIYAHNPALKLNDLLPDMTMLLGLLKKGQDIDVDFDNELIPTDKSEARQSYKKKRGYFPSEMTSGPMTSPIENKQGNSKVKFEQLEELKRRLDNIESHGL